MEIAFAIPKWLLWAGGTIGLIVLIILAAFGVLMLWTFKDGIWPG